MGFQLTLIAAAICAMLLLMAGYFNARRGLSGLSLIPWDYVMIVAAILLVVCLGHMAMLWRDGQTP